MLKSDVYYVLDADKQWAKARIAELEKQIGELGPEFEEAFGQSSETWHDNAPFEAVRDKQTLLAAERFSLKQILNKASLNYPKPPNGKVGIGSVVTVNDSKKTSKLLIAGHWSPNTGEIVEDILVVTCISPIGQALLGKVTGQTATIAKPPRSLTVQSVQN